jgi:hypothetical protein
MGHKTLGKMDNKGWLAWPVTAACPGYVKPSSVVGATKTTRMYQEYADNMKPPLFDPSGAVEMHLKSNFYSINKNDRWKVWVNLKQGLIQDERGLVGYIEDINPMNLIDSASREPLRLADISLPEEKSKKSPFDDVREAENELSILTETERRQVIDARIGQGKFRESLFRPWNGCSVTKVKERSLLRASHIKPWRSCNNLERLDPYNGLLLIPNLDHLFDQCLISFSDDSTILISPELSEEDAKALGVSEDMQLHTIYDENKPYLEFHRELCGFASG